MILLQMRSYTYYCEACMTCKLDGMHWQRILLKVLENVVNFHKYCNQLWNVRINHAWK